MKKLLLTGAFAMASFLNANAQITLNLESETGTGITWQAAYFGNLGAAGAFTGTFTGVDFDVVLDASNQGTYANDLAVLVATGLGQNDEIVAQLGGGSNFQATQTVLGTTGNSDAAGTAWTESLDLETPIVIGGSNLIFFIGNGYFNEEAVPEGTNTGTWSGTVTFKGITAATVGIDENNINALSVFPNPANDIINVMNNENILVNAVSITDINGRTVRTVKFNGVTEAQINVADLAAGVYMVSVSSDKGITTKKIVKN